ncbi:MAG: aminotransferase class I/II-fold pyridoxal phosphate-dependent enzyme [candidate division Zixibacteria bacterium]|nr:aminotransferase class I/II-fold pyridoxal phosphate-dependent enzyme [candidate division Zixibacteria bacterium]
MRKVLVEKAVRLEKVPPYPLFDFNRVLKRLDKKGVEIIDLGRFDPALPLPDSIQKILPLLQDKKTFGYAEKEEIFKVKELFSFWFKKRYGVSLNPKTEIFFYSGKRETLTQLALSFINPGDKIFVCEPTAQLYKGCALLAEGKIEVLPLLERNDYLPNLGLLKNKHKDEGKFFFLNYPHNPTGSLADLFFYKELVEVALKNNIRVVQDASYNEIYFEEFQPPSLMQAEGGKRVGVELHSLSTGTGIPGIDCGFIVGDKEMISGLESQSRLFSRQPTRLVLKLAEVLLEEYETIISKNKQEYNARRDVMTELLLSLGWRARKPKATPLFWAQIPGRYSSLGFCRMLLRKTGVIASPGVEYGGPGEGFIRLSLNQPEEKLKEAGERIREQSHFWQKRFRS